MNTPFLTWLCIVAFMLLIIVINICASIQRKHMKHKPLFQIGKEFEEFFIPGDRTKEEDFDDDETI